MDKNASIVIIITGIVIVLVIALAFGLDSKAVKLTSEDILRINNDVYKVEDFETFIRYTLYKNSGEISIDDHGHDHSADIANGATEEDIFLSDTLESFYQLKVMEKLVNDKNITLTSGELQEIEKGYSENEATISNYNIAKEDFIEIETLQLISENITNNTSEYLTLPDDIYEEYISNFSGEDLKSYTYRVIQVGYTPDKTSGEGSGEASGEVEIIPGDKDEKKAYMDALVARIESGEAFEKVGESGDSRIVFAGNQITLIKCDEEYAAGMLFKQKIGEDLYEVAKDLKAGEMTDVVDTGSEFQIALIVDVKDEIAGKAKDELADLLLSDYKDEVLYSYVKDLEINNAIMTRIKIK